MPRTKADLPERIKVARALRRVSQSDLARALSVNRSAVGQWEADLTAPNSEHLRSAAVFLQVDYNWLATGRGGPTSGEQGSGAIKAGRQAGRGVLELDPHAELGGVGVGATKTRRDGNYTDPVKEDMWIFPEGFLVDELQVNPRDVVVIETLGDSMRPTIQPGERVLIDTKHKRPSPDGIYALRDTFGALVIKRLQCTSAGQVKIISDNSAHADEVVDQGQVRIVGRVIVGLRRLG